MRSYLVALHTSLSHFAKPAEEWGNYNYNVDTTPLLTFLDKGWRGGDSFAVGGHDGKFLRKHCTRHILSKPANVRLTHDTPYANIFTVDREMLDIALAAVRAELRADVETALSELRGRADYTPRAGGSRAIPTTELETAISQLLSLDWNEDGDASEAEVDQDLAARCRELHQELSK